MATKNQIAHTICQWTKWVIYCIIILQLWTSYWNLKIKAKDYNYEPIGTRIKTARVNKKYTQEYVAEKLDVSCQHISDIERGLNGMSIPSLMEICRVLEVSADYILFGITSDATVSNPINTILNQMTPQQSMYAEEILKAYAKSCGIR